MSLKRDKRKQRRQTSAGWNAAQNGAFGSHNKTDETVCVCVWIDGKNGTLRPHGCQKLYRIPKSAGLNPCRFESGLRRTSIHAGLRTAPATTADGFLIKFPHRFSSNNRLFALRMAFIIPTYQGARMKKTNHAEIQADLARLKAESDEVAGLSRKIKEAIKHYSLTP